MELLETLRGRLEGEDKVIPDILNDVSVLFAMNKGDQELAETTVKNLELLMDAGKLSKDEAEEVLNYVVSGGGAHQKDLERDQEEICR